WGSSRRSSSSTCASSSSPRAKRFRRGRAAFASEQRPAQNEKRHAEIDHEARHVDERRDERSGRAGRVEAYALEQEWKHRARDRPETNDPDQRRADGDSDEEMMR